MMKPTFRFFNNHLVLIIQDNTDNQKTEVSRDVQFGTNSFWVKTELLKTTKKV